MACRTHALHRAEVCGRCDDANVPVQRAGERVVHSANDVILTLPVAEDAVLVTEHLLCLRDRDADRDPVTRRGALRRGEVEPVR